MQLDKYLVSKGGMFCALEPGMESWYRRWGAPVDRSIYDTIEMTDEELNALLPQIETMGYSGSDLMLEPSLKEFVLRMKDSSGRGENTVLFRETLMPEAGPVRDGELSRTDRPLLDAYFFFGKGSTADVVVNMGSCRFEDGNGKYTTCTYQRPVWARDWQIMEDRYLIDLFRYIKFGYMLIQKALYERPVVFSEASSRKVSRPAYSPKGNRKRKRVVKAVRVMRTNAEEFARYARKQREMSCPCWGVIGHWRNCRSGKKVWVRPYRKGRERDNPAAYSPKEYQLAGEKEARS